MSKRQRDLRRAMANLLSNPIQDVEAIWNALSPDERERLKPMMASASGLHREVDMTWAAGTGDHVKSKTSNTSDDDIARLVHRMQTMPDMLARSLLCSLDPESAKAVVGCLPEKRRRDLENREDAPLLTAHARAAWIEACLQGVAQADIDQPSRDVAKQPGAPARLIKHFLCVLRQRTTRKAWAR
ncbi:MULTISPECIES: hypothetical protein [unclassified Caballeronia]|uniref:hypothetical protein n=1 Tax=unclassified Caballeronia TaxID=2646786 RepID=UPI00285D050F|nr:MULTISPECIES: hypothetical protein [unclassified Caballeronia]MDR5774156.1 hypothetical protein [Caballeronia sp. LZ002]MDR5849591.1 hypothetical protein [Caballeronia sp. LZ003]